MSFAPSARREVGPQVDAIDPDRTAVGLLDPGQQPQQGRLADAVRPAQRMDAGCEAAAQVPQDPPGAVGFAYPFETQHRWRAEKGSEAA